MDDRDAPDAMASQPDGQGHESAGVLGEELTAVLHRAMEQAAHRLQTVAAAVYLLPPGGDELLAAMIGGSPPSILTLPGRPRMQEPENGQRLRGCRRWEAGGTSAMLRVPALANRGGPPLGRPCGGPVGVS
ncbi:hypothetical protein [Streptomyces sp. NPDC056227]|uniref:hypothetical protein n=1 Tax=Streptomyces sp. NPDC056227 TaxID=3345753 RepID=UPI0035E079DB